jgi:hypothetical protein
LQITGFDADASDAEWSINIKKGLATKLQMDVVAGEIGKGETAFLRTVEVNRRNCPFIIKRKNNFYYFRLILYSHIYLGHCCWYM